MLEAFEYRDGEEIPCDSDNFKQLLEYFRNQYGLNARAVAEKVGFTLSRVNQLKVSAKGRTILLEEVDAFRSLFSELLSNESRYRHVNCDSENVKQMFRYFGERYGWTFDRVLEELYVSPKDEQKKDLRRILFGSRRTVSLDMINRFKELVNKVVSGKYDVEENVCYDHDNLNRLIKYMLDTHGLKMPDIAKASGLDYFRLKTLQSTRNLKHMKRGEFDMLTQFFSRYMS